MEEEEKLKKPRVVWQHGGLRIVVGCDLGWHLGLAFSGGGRRKMVWYALEERDVDRMGADKWVSVGSWCPSNDRPADPLRPGIAEKLMALIIEHHGSIFENWHNPKSWVEKPAPTPTAVKRGGPYR